MLLQQTDHQAETTHDYIQWLFPLDEPSRSVNGAPVLAELDIDEIRQSSLAQANLAKSAGWFPLKKRPLDHQIQSEPSPDNSYYQVVASVG